ncbi:hypothetical protein ACOSP7_032669 [Xanthoceras sorbifolium]|uniref:Uncharacterized protein n=1 Tax=Xanthoceras sorbifolium TaxID=99658 RepID=A0ABQ8H3Z3_9ROSI|nr:hypothetical protein JRO89_XS14G0055200 [Xanthoceras sorbifolium]
MASSTTKLRLFVDTKAGKVLFAEADKDFIDFLIYLLSLPIATAVRILKDKNMHLAGVGSLGHLSETYIKTGKTKDLLINPRGVLHPTEIPLLLSDLNSRKVYMCSGLCSEPEGLEVLLLEEKVVALGVDEGLQLLKASMESKTVLTSVFLGNTAA